MKNAMMHTVQIEDFLLLLWLIVIEPWLLRAYGEDLAAESGVRLGVFYLLACLLALVAYVTRSNEAETGPTSGRMTPGNYARLAVLGPLIFIGAISFDLMGVAMGAAPFMILAGTVFVLALAFPQRLPRLPRLARRLLMTPLVLVGAAWFARFSALAFDNLAPGELLEALRTTSANPIPTLLLFASFVYYLGFVFAPRQVADGEGSWLQWALRYGLYLAAILLNVRLGWM